MSAARTDFDLVTFASSAGGIPALVRVLAALPAGLPVPIVVVHHLARHRSVLDEVLRRSSFAPVHWAVDGAPLLRSTVHIAPINRHLVFDGERNMQLLDEARVNWAQPAADPTFTSMAERFGARALAVVLSGAGSDGELGVVALHRAGGSVLAQDQATSAFGGMPAGAARSVATRVLPLDEIAPAIVALVAEKTRTARRPSLVRLTRRGGDE